MLTNAAVAVEQADALGIAHVQTRFSVVVDQRAVEAHVLLGGGLTQLAAVTQMQQKIILVAIDRNHRIGVF